ncbi:MAG: hypothetical protein JKY56_05135 [Kofleriaceae bacterium]|nr:hypothetical protein [Kofleriaceae bacterium]
MKYLCLISCLLFSVPACREAPSDQECKAVAVKRSRFIFAGKTGKNADRSRKQEYTASLEECAEKWTKSEAQCVAKARNRNQVLACR